VQIVNLINEIYNKLGAAIITVKHVLAIAQYVADRVVVLDDGRLVEEGLINDVLNNPRSNFMKTIISNYSGPLM
jgi:ABC-type glutathione transport system ATPase component